MTWSDIPTNLIDTPRAPPWAQVVVETEARETTARGRDHLGGTCRVNALTLADELHDEGLTPRIVFGWCDLPLLGTPDGPADAYACGCAHYWVEVGPENYVAELAAEVGDLYTPAIFARRPQQYNAFGSVQYAPGMDGSSVAPETFE